MSIVFYICNALLNKTLKVEFEAEDSCTSPSNVDKNEWFETCLGPKLFVAAIYETQKQLPIEICELIVSFVPKSSFIELALQQYENFYRYESSVTSVTNLKNIGLHGNIELYLFCFVFAHGYLFQIYFDDSSHYLLYHWLVWLLSCIFTVYNWFFIITVTGATLLIHLVFILPLNKMIHEYQMLHDHYQNQEREMVELGFWDSNDYTHSFSDTASDTSHNFKSDFDSRESTVSSSLSTTYSKQTVMKWKYNFAAKLKLLKKVKKCIILAVYRTCNIFNHYQSNLSSFSKFEYLFNFDFYSHQQSSCMHAFFKLFWMLLFTYMNVIYKIKDCYFSSYTILALSCTTLVVGFLFNRNNLHTTIDILSLNSQQTFGKQIYSSWIYFKRIIVPYSCFDAIIPVTLFCLFILLTKCILHAVYFIGFYTFYLLSMFITININAPTTVWILREVWCIVFTFCITSFHFWNSICTYKFLFNYSDTINPLRTFFSVENDHAAHDAICETSFKAIYGCEGELAEACRHLIDGEASIYVVKSWLVMFESFKPITKYEKHFTIPLHKVLNDVEKDLLQLYLYHIHDKYLFEMTLKDFTDFLLTFDIEQQKRSQVKLYYQHCLESFLLLAKKYGRIHEKERKAEKRQQRRLQKQNFKSNSKHLTVFGPVTANSHLSVKKNNWKLKNAAKYRQTKIPRRTQSRNQ